MLKKLLITSALIVSPFVVAGASTNGMSSNMNMNNSMSYKQIMKNETRIIRENKYIMRSLRKMEQQIKMLYMMKNKQKRLTKVKYNNTDHHMGSRSKNY